MSGSADRPAAWRLGPTSLILASVVLLIGSSYAVERFYLAPLREKLESVRLNPQPPLWTIVGIRSAGWILDHQFWLMAGAVGLCGIALGGGLDKHIKAIAIAVVGCALLGILLQTAGVVGADLWLPPGLRRLGA